MVDEDVVIYTYGLVTRSSINNGHEGVSKQEVGQCISNKEIEESIMANKLGKIQCFVIAYIILPLGIMSFESSMKKKIVVVIVIII